mgnify:CR=1 FL=1
MNWIARLRLVFASWRTSCRETEKKSRIRREKKARRRGDGGGEAGRVGVAGEVSPPSVEKDGGQHVIRKIFDE